MTSIDARSHSLPAGSHPALVVVDDQDFRAHEHGQRTAQAIRIGLSGSRVG